MMIMREITLTDEEIRAAHRLHVHNRLVEIAKDCFRSYFNIKPFEVSTKQKDAFVKKFGFCWEAAVVQSSEHYAMDYIANEYMERFSAKQKNGIDPFDVVLAYADDDRPAFESCIRTWEGKVLKSQMLRGGM